MPIFSRFRPKQPEPEDVAIAVLFTAWQVPDGEPLIMLSGITGSSDDSMRSEIVVLQGYVSTLAVIQTLGKDVAVCQRFLGAFHLANGVLAGFADTVATDARSRLIVAHMKSRVEGHLAAFAGRYPKEHAMIERARRHPPASLVVQRRSLAYAAAFDESGGDVERGFQLVSQAFCTETGAPRHPIAAAAALVLLMSQFRAVTSSLPSYRLT